MKSAHERRQERHRVEAGGLSSMELSGMQKRAHRVRRFLTVQLIALIGWILVQSFFSLSPPGRTIPYVLSIMVQAIWWIATLVVMFLLFKREHDSFVVAVLDLEEAHRRLKGGNE
jgi:FtsH-binding integral membrane protein